MTNEEIESYPFKHHSLGLQLTKALSLLRALLDELDGQLGTASANYEITSEAKAEARGITQWASYDPSQFCSKPKHYSKTLFVKTSQGWIHHCCAKELGLPKLPNAYVEPTIDEIKSSYAERKHELEMIVEYRKRVAAKKGAATKKAQAEKLAKEKELKIAARAAKKASMTPEEIADKKAVRAQRKAEKALKEVLIDSIQGE